MAQAEKIKAYLEVRKLNVKELNELSKQEEDDSQRLLSKLASNFYLRTKFIKG